MNYIEYFNNFFVNEHVNDYNLYHFTTLESLYEIINDGSIFPFYDKLLGAGISTTRNKNLKWFPDINNIRLVFDKNEIKNNYKVTPYHWFNIKHGIEDYRKYGPNKKPYTNQDIPANQYEERIITETPLPLKYIKQIDIIGYINNDDLSKLKNMIDIPINNL